MQQKQVLKHDIELDIPLAQESNILISGTNNSGKSRLSCGIASVLHGLGWQVVAFDNSGIYQKISDLPTIYRVMPKTLTQKIPIDLHNSMIYDLALLTSEEQRSLVNDVLGLLWVDRVNNEPKQWTLILLEEMHLYARNVRGELSQNLLRVMSVGRNQKLRVLGVTVDLALVDSAFIRLCQQRYHGKLGIEANSKRRFRAYYGQDWCRVATELTTGLFLYLNRDNLKIVNIPLFESETKPEPYRKTTLRQRVKKWLNQ